ncbi:MAG: DUF1592 domain-containing protein [Planctomycetales bacterium]
MLKRKLAATLTNPKRDQGNLWVGDRTESSCMRLGLVLALIAVAGTARGDSSAELQQQSMAAFESQVRPLLRRYCLKCHGEKKQNGDVRLDALNPDMAAGQDGETWHDALNKMNLGEMPPKDDPQPTQSERAVLAKWINGELARAIAARRSTGGRVVMRRLTRYEYANTMRDLLGLELDFAEDLTAEPNSPDKLKNNGSTLQMSPRQMEHYLTIARRAVAKAIVTGDRPETLAHHLKNIGGGKGPLHPPNIALTYFPQYPMEGEFLIRVEASVAGGTDAAADVRVVMGVRPSPKNLKTKDVGVVKVTGDKERPQTIELRGRMENFPLHDPGTAYRERRYPGLQIGFWNMTHDQRAGKGSKKPRKSKKSKGEPRQEEARPLGGPTVAIHSVRYEAPIHATWPPSHHARILFPSELSQTDPREYARAVLERFMRRAYRRPVTAEEVERKLNVHDAWRESTGSIELAMREVLPEILISHNFLYLAEPTDGREKRQRVTDFELASRLSYFLWSTMPDERLSELAAGGTLSEPAVLANQVREMLKLQASWNFVQHFTDQWLDLARIDRVAVNPEYYPDFDNRLKGYMREETQRFFAELLNNDLSALSLLDSDFTMLNRPLAEHYGITGPRDQAFVRVALKPEDHRGGLLGHGGILLSNSSGDDSHPIYRGVFIRDRLLGDTPASPPPDVPNLKEAADLTKLSLKQQLELHRQKPACNSCHRNIDPWGIPLENFDAVGRWRTEVQRAITPGEPTTFNNGVLKKRGKPPKFAAVPVEAAATLPGGEELRGIDGLQSHLMKHERKRFTRALVSRMLAYGLGRSLELVDAETVDSLVATFEKSGYQLDELIVAITQSEPFQMK